MSENIVKMTPKRQGLMSELMQEKLALNPPDGEEGDWFFKIEAGNRLIIFWVKRDENRKGREI